jgi:hypothetical protein
MATNRTWLNINDWSDKDITCSGGQIRIKDGLAINLEVGNAPVVGGTPDTVPTDLADGGNVIEIFDNLLRYWVYDAGTDTYTQIGDVPRGGESNTASNVGTDGEGVFKQKTGVDLEFRNIAPADAKVTVVLNGDDIDIGLGSVAINDLSDVNAASVTGGILYFNGVTWDDLPIGNPGDLFIVNDAGTAGEWIDETVPLDCTALGTH